jgi:hypothetical protein
VDASEVTLTLKAFSDMLVHDVLFDNSPTGTNGLCTPDFTAIPPFCSSGMATFEISAFRIGGVFFKTGNTPYDFSSSHRLAVFSLRGVHLDDELPLVIPKNTTFQVTLRVSDASVPPENDVAVKATFGVTGGTGVSLTTETGPVNP